ncbi:MULTISPECIES: flagellar hook assembly protein FlgD [Yersinia pseudotuberculosis complex]|uniref:Basal-body rod modification protein FlgD n=1 Tax=Yersinia similis TaxID=367190 RepID=A0A0T9RCI1_9GAMM|nr:MULTISPECIES: flagellar hook assembly protein FlgD [Yersinia pseudotuberculosis complex]AHK18573.1 flagellar basal body rod modification protein [Yersinia similis]CFQ70262.1 flagellar basal body rod modification protein [Yersinia similis]CFV33961.1 flagellar basal body rod modification protein [Yersinia pseudotuberculosis]CNC29040.1 flagellar basal body rod modification protein [Yersinia similis]CNG39927.1 flagellar basal body rod modification protein [Yersinia similis]
MQINESRNLANIGNQSPALEGGLPGGEQLNNQFMTLLVAQIKNQDPLNPADGTEFVSQMAQLSQVQATENMAKLLKSNTVQMAKMQTMAAANLVGQQVMVESNEITLDKASVAGRLTLKQPAPTLLLHVTDMLGHKQVIDLGKQPAGPVNFTLDPVAAKLQPGQYQISAVSGSGEELIPLEVAGKVNNVRISPQGGAPQLNIAGLGEVSYRQITQFGA